MKIDWIPDGSQWDVTRDRVRVEFTDRPSAHWPFLAVILAIICVIEVWNWLNLQPPDTDPRLLLWTALVLAAYALLGRRVPSIKHICASGDRVELRDTDENMVLLSASDEIAPEIEEIALGEMPLWSVRVEGPTLTLETPSTPIRLGPHKLSRALQKMGDGSQDACDTEPPASVSCPKLRTYGAVALLIWLLGLTVLKMLGLTVHETMTGEQWWELLIACILVLPYAVQGLSPTFCVHLRLDPAGQRLARVGLFGRWRRLDELFVGLRGTDTGLIIVPIEFVRKRRHVHVALWLLIAPPVYPREGVAGVFAFTRLLRGRVIRPTSERTRPG